MSKKQLLNESEIRRFMKLANLEPLTKAVVTEMAAANQIPQDERRPETGMQQEMADKADEAKGLSMEAEEAEEAEEAPEAAEGGEEMEVEVGGDVDPEKQSAFEAAVQALADAMGIEVDMEGAGAGEEEAGEEMPDLDMAAPEGEEAGEEKADEEELDEAKEEEKEEKALSEDALVEAVLARVTARLVAEAKKKKMSVKEKMKLKSKKKEAKKEVVEEALDGVNLSEKGKEQKNVWKGHADMEMGKGEKGGKGGHELETLSAKAEHTVTHGGKNLATLGGNKK